MSDFKIEEILSQESFHMEPKGDFPGGDFTSYMVRFSGEQGSGQAIVKRKQASAAPAAGEVIDAEIVRKGDKTELKRIWKQEAGGGGGRSNGGGGSKSGDFRTPEQIMMGDAIGKALHWCDIKVAAAEWQPMTWEQLESQIDRFYDKLRGASK